jgi:hypothetical protein
MSNFGNAELIGINLFKNIDCLSGFAYDTNRFQPADMFFVFTEKGYVRGQIHGDIMEV